MSTSNESYSPEELKRCCEILKSASDFKVFILCCNAKYHNISRSELESYINKTYTNKLFMNTLILLENIVVKYDLVFPRQAKAAIDLLRTELYKNIDKERIMLFADVALIDIEQSIK